MNIIKIYAHADEDRCQNNQMTHWIVCMVRRVGKHMDLSLGMTSVANALDDIGQRRIWEHAFGSWRRGAEVAIPVTEALRIIFWTVPDKTFVFCFPTLHPVACRVKETTSACEEDLLVPKKLCLKLFTHAFSDSGKISHLLRGG